MKMYKNKRIIKNDFIFKFIFISNEEAKDNSNKEKDDTRKKH